MDREPKKTTENVPGSPSKSANTETKKSPLLAVLVIILIILSISQLTLLTTVYMNRRNIENELKDTGVRIHNLEAIIDRSIGKFIEIKPPPAFTSKLEDLKNRLNNQLSMAKLTEIEDEFNQLVSNTPKWVLDESFSDLKSVSTNMQLRHLLLQAQAELNQANVDILVESFDNSFVNLTKEEKEYYQNQVSSIVNALVKKEKKLAEDGIRVLQSRYDELNSNPNATLSDYTSLAVEIERFGEFDLARGLNAKVANKMELLQIWSQLTRLEDVLQHLPDSGPESRMELLSQCSSEAMGLHETVIGTSDKSMVEKHRSLVDIIEREIATTNQQISKNLNSRINRYNLWALDTITGFKEEKAKIQKQMGLFGKVPKEQGLESIFDLLKKELLAIDQGLLLDSVREVYVEAYSDASSFLADEYKLRVAKAAATAERKTLTDTAGYQHNNP